MDGVASYSFDREGPRRIRTRAPEGAGAGATWAPLGGLGVSWVLALGCALGRKAIFHVALHTTMEQLELPLAVGLVASGVVVALLRAHVRGVPLVALPALGIATLPLLAGAAAARLDYGPAMREDENGISRWTGSEHAMFVLGIGTVISLALAVSLAIAVRRIETEHRAPRTTSWLAYATITVAVGGLVETFAHWVIPGSAGLSRSAVHSLHDWDALFCALPLARAAVGGVLVVCMAMAVTRGVRARAWASLATAGGAIVLWAGVALTTHAVLDGVEQLVLRAPAAVVARAADLVPTAFEAYDYIGTPDLLIGRDAITDAAGHRTPRSALTHVARRVAGPRIDEVPGLLPAPYYYGPSRRRMLLTAEPQLRVVLDARLDGAALARVLDDLGAAGVGRVALVGPDARTVPAEELRTPLLRLGARRYVQIEVDLESGAKRELAANQLRVRATGLHDGTIVLTATRGPTRTWRVGSDGRSWPVVQAGAAVDATIVRDTWGDPDLPLRPGVVWLPVTLGSPRALAQAVVQLAAGDIRTVLCARACP